MEILSNNLETKKYNKVSEGGKKCLEVSTGGKKYGQTYIIVSLLEKTWKVKSGAESRWLKVATIENWLRENLSDIVGAIEVCITGYIIYCLIVIFS